MDLVDAPNATAITAFAEAIDTELSGTHGAGSWETVSSATFVLSASAPALIAINSGGTITIHRGDSFSVQLTDLGSLVGRTKLWFTVKKNSGDADSKSLIQIEETGQLLYLNGAAAVTPAQGTLTVDDEDDGDITIPIDEAATVLLVPGDYLYDVQSLIAGSVTTRTVGKLVVNEDITRAIA